MFCTNTTQMRDKRIHRNTIKIKLSHESHKSVSKAKSNQTHELLSTEFKSKFNVMIKTRVFINTRENSVLSDEM